MESLWLPFPTNRWIGRDYPRRLLCASSLIESSSESKSVPISPFSESSDFLSDLAIFLGISSFNSTVTEPLPLLPPGRPRPGRLIVSPGLEPAGILILRSAPSGCGIITSVPSASSTNPKGSAIRRSAPSLSNQGCSFTSIWMYKSPLSPRAPLGASP